MIRYSVHFFIPSFASFVFPTMFLKFYDDDDDDDNKQLLDEVFVTLIILDSTKTESNNCFIIHCTKKMSRP